MAIAVDNRPEPKSLLQDVTLELTEQRIGVIGANGSGKSTLLRLINGLVQPSSGTVSVAGADTVRAVRAVRRQVGFVFTDPLSQLVMPTGREDVELSLRRPVRNGAERRRLADSALERLGLLPLADQSIYELSGGERQLMALAAVLAVNPAVLVLDEPSTLLGLAGLPIFSQGRSGLSILAGPSAGYIIAFPIAAAVVGWLAIVVIRRTTRARALWFFASAMVTSIAFVHTLGVAGIALNTKASLGDAFLADLVFYPGDVIKNILAAVIAVALHRAFPDVLVRRVKRINN